MAAKAADDQSVKFWSLPQALGIELLRAKYTTQNFSRHIHDGYAFGVIEQGALAFSYRGEHLVAPAGAINLVIRRSRFFHLLTTEDQTAYWSARTAQQVQRADSSAAHPFWYQKGKYYLYICDLDRVYNPTC